MNSVTSLVQLGIYFLIPLAVSSVIGFLCRAVVNWADAKDSEVFRSVGLVLLTITLCGLPFLGAFLAGAIVVLVAICAVGAFAERVVSSAGISWGAALLRLVLATVCCVLLSFFVCTVLSYIVVPRKWEAAVQWFELGSVAGALGSASVVPIFIWLWRSSQMRPGVDRHLDTDNGA